METTTSVRPPAADSRRLKHVPQERARTLAATDELPGLVEYLVHDLSQPLSAIGNFASACRLLADKGDTDREAKVSAYSEKISDQVMRAGEMVAMMRALMKRLVTGDAPERLEQLVRDALWMTGVSCEQVWEVTGTIATTIDKPAEIQWMLWRIFGELSGFGESWHVNLSEREGATWLRLERRRCGSDLSSALPPAPLPASALAKAKKLTASLGISLEAFGETEAILILCFPQQTTVMGE